MHFTLIDGVAKITSVAIYENNSNGCCDSVSKKYLLSRVMLDSIATHKALITMTLSI